MSVAFVYLLHCADDTLYCGWTTDIERRLAAHRGGTASRYTRSRRPVELAAVVPVADRSTALREEARIKRLPRAAKLLLIEVLVPGGPSGVGSGSRTPRSECRSLDEDAGNSYRQSRGKEKTSG